MGIRIEPERIYREHELIAECGFSFNELVRARERGLRFKVLGRGRRAYLGRWLLDWLTRPEEVQR